jgi:hypothetical protein
MARDAAGFVNYFTVLPVRRLGVMEGLREDVDGSRCAEEKAAE